MAQLSKILSSILRDMVAAQHEANMYALKLSAAYRNQNQVVSLNPPAVSLGEIELMLHCGFTGESVTSKMYEIDQTMVLCAIHELSLEISESMVTCILSSIIHHTEEYREGESPIARLNREKTLRRNFIAFLGRKLYGYLKGHRAEFINIDGSIDIERLQEAILFVADDKILSHSEMEEVFANDTSEQLEKTVREELRTHVVIMLPRILKDIQIGKPVDYASFDVVVASGELAKLPDECIQTFKLKISPHDIPAEPDAE